MACTIAPFERSVQIDCATAGETLAALHLLYVVDVVAVDRTHRTEALRGELRTRGSHAAGPPTAQASCSITAATALPWEDT